MIKITINSYNSYKYSGLYKITQFKDGCVWKTKFEGFISNKDKIKYPRDLYIFSSISTKLTKDDFCTLKPFIP